MELVVEGLVWQEFFVVSGRETDWMARVLTTPFNDPARLWPKRVHLYAPRHRECDGAGLDCRSSNRRRYPPARQQRGRFCAPLPQWQKSLTSSTHGFPHCYSAATTTEHLRYFDYWLKGVDNGAMNDPPVRVQVRTGNGAHYMLQAAEWPLPQTQYLRWYLDAQPSDWKGDGRPQ